MQSRSELRIDLRKKRQIISKSTDFWKICPVAAQERLLAELADANVIGLYRAVGGEVSPQRLFEDYAGRRFALPRVEGRGERMTFHRWSPGEALEKADFGFEQPSANAEIVTPDLILVPLLGFDSRLNRLGQGAGHYDRYFAAHPEAKKIGLAWACQEVDALPVEAWDVPLDAVLTERGWITAR